MNIIELMVVLTIVSFLISATIANFLKISDIDLTEQYIETAVYAGLWKAELYKVYDENKCTIFSTNNKSFNRASEICFSNMEVFSFRWVKGGTYSGISIEPIVFKVSGGGD